MLLNKNAPPGTVPVKIYTDEIEPTALQQLKNIAQLPIVHSQVAAGERFANRQKMLKAVREWKSSRDFFWGVVGLRTPRYGQFARGPI